MIPSFSLSYSSYDVSVILAVCLGFEFIVKPFLRSFILKDSSDEQKATIYRLLVIFICIALIVIKATDPVLGVLQGIIDGCVCASSYDLIISKLVGNNKGK